MGIRKLSSTQRLVLALSLSALIAPSLAASKASSTFFSQLSNQQIRQQQHRLFRRQQEAAEVENREPAPPVDLHNSEFCVDVSTFGDITFEETQREKCDTAFEKNCETKTEQVCDEVTEIQCDIVPFTECTMSMEATPYRSYEMIPKIYKKKECTEGMDTVQHTKMMPECRNVTKQNCITNWETDDEGNQVWAGNEACEPVTWRECKLVPRQVDFKVPKIDCRESDEIPYTDCEDAEKTQMTTKMTCEVKHTTDCKPVTSTKCQSIQYQECAEEPIETCEEQPVMVPTQEKEHKKKCLLPDDGINGVSPSPRTAKAVNLAAKLQGRGNGKKVALNQVSRSAKNVVAADNAASPAVVAASAAPAPQISLDRLASAASNTRQARVFSGVNSQPRFIDNRGQVVTRPVAHRRPVQQGQFVRRS